MTKNNKLIHTRFPTEEKLLKAREYLSNIHRSQKCWTIKERVNQKKALAIFIIYTD